jgi:hypothetical protein
MTNINLNTSIIQLAVFFIQWYIFVGLLLRLYSIDLIVIVIDEGIVWLKSINNRMKRVCIEWCEVVWCLCSIYFIIVALRLYFAFVDCCNC